MITEYRIIELVFFIQQIILSAFNMLGTVLGNKTGKQQQQQQNRGSFNLCHHIAYI